MLQRTVPVFFTSSLEIIIMRSGNDNHVSKVMFFSEFYMNFTKSLSEDFQDVFAVRSLGLHWLVAAEHPFDLSGVKLDGKICKLSTCFNHENHSD